MKDKRQTQRMQEAMIAAAIIAEKNTPRAAKMWLVRFYDKELQEIAEFIRYTQNPTIIEDPPK